MEFDFNAYMKAHTRICFLHDAVESKRILPEDIAALTELATEINRQVIHLRHDATERLEQQGFFIKPGYKITGLNRDGNLETISALWIKGSDETDD